MKVKRCLVDTGCNALEFHFGLVQLDYMHNVFMCIFGLEYMSFERSRSQIAITMLIAITKNVDQDQHRRNQEKYPENAENFDSKLRKHL